MSPASRIRRILLSAVIMISGYSVFLLMLGTPAELAESNWQSNLIRLQVFVYDDPPRSVLLGSSLSGRLLPRYFKGTTLDPFANLGLDGSGPAVGLDLIVQRPVPIVLVEENHLLKSKYANDELLETTLKSFGFRLARYAKILRAQSRPSSILYSWMKTRATQRLEIRPDFMVPQRGPTAPMANLEGGHLEPDHAKMKVRERIGALRALGCQVVFVRLPSDDQSQPSKNASIIFAGELAKEFHLREIDLQGEFARLGQPIAFTDGIHLAPVSAKVASRILTDLLTDP